MHPLNGRGVQPHVLLVEDESEVRNYIQMALRCQGYTVQTAENGEEALECLQENRDGFSVVLLDLMMPRKNGMETLHEIRMLDADLPVIMISAAATPFNVVDAMRCGAVDFLGKPVSHEDLRKTLKLALERRPKKPAATAPQAKTPGKSVKSVLASVSPQMRELELLIDQIGWSEAPILIQGETGAGKEVMARQLHAKSPRANKPLLKLNCAALPSELVESELFGYERGAFTGAFQRKLGMFELADGGTLFLDEIGDMPFKLQAKLLQVLQDGEFQRLGGKETIHVDVRIMAATHNDLTEAVATRAFREDLYYRLNVLSMRVPPLRERPEDILPFAEFFLALHALPGSPVPVLTEELKDTLLAHSWRGNVRELENVMRRLLVLRSPNLIMSELSIRNRTAKPIETAPPPPIVPSAMPIASAFTPSVPPVSVLAATASASAAGFAPFTPSKPPAEARPPIFERVNQAKNQAETEAILAALNSTRWNRKQASALLKIDYKALLYKMKKLSIEDQAGTPPFAD